jgi:hypothetical protein
MHSQEGSGGIYGCDYTSKVCSAQGRAVDCRRETAASPVGSLQICFASAMRTILDIDLDFFTSPIKNWGSLEERVPEEGASVETVDATLDYLVSHCCFPDSGRLPGAKFEHHDEVFDFAIKHWRSPVHLIHFDAHADIGGGLSSGWRYVLTDYLHLSAEDRRKPKRGEKYLNCGNFIVFLAACGLIERVTFVSHPNWCNDYGSFYMRDFDSEARALQMKRYTAKSVDDASVSTDMWNIPHELEPCIPFERVTKADFRLQSPPDMLLLTRSPGFTPASADVLFDVLVERIEPF